MKQSILPFRYLACPLQDLPPELAVAVATKVGGARRFKNADQRNGISAIFKLEEVLYVWGNDILLVLILME